MLAHPMLAAKEGLPRNVAQQPAKGKAMSTEVYERISSHIAKELKSGAPPRLKPWNAASAAERITHCLPGTTRADVKDVNDAAA